MQAPAFKGAAHLYRLRGSPALPSDMPAIQQFAARGSHLVLYALVIAMPLIGWAMLSAGGYPITLLDAWHSPAILPQNVDLFALLRALHTWLAFPLFATILADIAAGLFHGLIRRDGVFSSMARGHSLKEGLHDFQLSEFNGKSP